MLKKLHHCKPQDSMSSDLRKTFLIPRLLKTSPQKKMKVPQMVFEISDVYFRDESHQSKD